MRATTTMKTASLEVPGAAIYYEVRGSGPVLLLMPGGPADAGTFRRMETDLAKSYTVITYDPRDLSHSKTHEPTDDARMVEIYSDDVHRLLRAVAGDEKASIFGSSGGGLIALELVKRHPEQLDVVVIHEPPSPQFLPDPAGTLRAMEDVSDTFATDGLWPASQKFMTLVGAPQEGSVQVEARHEATPEHEPTPEQKDAMAAMEGNVSFFLGRYVRNIARYEPDVKSIKASGCRVVPAYGEDSHKEQLARKGAMGLAQALGTQPVMFPGDHGGFDGHPAEFAAKLREVLEG